MPSVTRFPAGVSTSPSNQLLGNFRDPNPINMHVLESDWDQYIAGDWTITTTTGSNALQAADGGIMRLSTSASSNDIQGIQKNPAAFKFTNGNQLWFGLLFSIATNATTVFRAGLMTGGTVLAPTDGVYFSKAAAGAIDFNIKTGGSTTTLSSVVAAPTDGTYMALGFYYDGNPVTPRIHIFSSQGMTLPSFPTNTNGNTGGREVTQTSTLTNLPTSILAPTFAIQTSTAAIRTMDMDYFIVGGEIVRF